jgi:hypothetical protein
VSAEEDPDEHPSITSHQCRTYQARANFPVVVIDEGHQQARTASTDLAAHMNPKQPADASLERAVTRLEFDGFAVRRNLVRFRAVPRPRPRGRDSNELCRYNEVSVLQHLEHPASNVYHRRDQLRNSRTYCYFQPDRAGPRPLTDPTVSLTDLIKSLRHR